MDSVQLWLRVWAMGYVLSMCLAANCTWKTQYEYKKKCCDACPSGTYPREPCSTQCVNCTSSNHWCHCGEMPLCTNEDCSACVARPLCKPGEELIRTGNFEFSYICKECPENMYNDKEDGTCGPIADCRKLGLDVLFPGNRTQNTRCGWQDSNQWTLKVIVVCLAINGLISLALLVNACSQRSTLKRKKTKRCSATCSLGMPSEECSCKLSKEEMGGACDLHSDDSSDESGSKCEV
ncbi:tumor necrosis factor receptor superfamily member 18 [Salminus brasiliensis]|uniref:tumor necrosis factor receptor superfamily member 18 n=1 Tax=Salminus brasiliensis TaxID=930266 RepID=UPI003B8328F7